MANFASTIGLLLVIAVTCQGFLQELILHEKMDETGNVFIFRSNVPDTSKFEGIEKTQRVCSRGIWYFFDELNFEGRSSGVHGYESNLFCSNQTFSAFDYKSLRHLASVDTSVDSISLYAEADFKGQETFITQTVTAGITHPVQSLSLTGPSNWTLFEGTFFNGTSVCRLGVPEGEFFDYAYSISDLPTVGSVLKGCEFTPEGPLF